MKKLSLALGALMVFGQAFAQAEEPIITLKTNIYDTYGASNQFHISLGATESTYFDVDCGYGPMENEVGPAEYDPDTQSISGTYITCQVSEEGIVKIYGDASLLDYFEAEGCYIDWIDLGDCTNLDVLSLPHNELKRLDLSKYTKLRAIYLTDNPFAAETPLVIGPDHPELTILEIGISDYLSPDFDITTYTKLLSFDAYANKSLSHLDPTNCPNLMRLCLDSCPIKSVDVSKNPELLVLNIEDSGISDIDLSNNTKLTQLYVTHESGFINNDAKFTKLDLSKNVNLTYLAASGNNLSQIDLSNNTKLTHVYLGNNQLTSLDVSDLSSLVVLDVKNNNMTFATLPLPNPAWYDYSYAQRNLKVNRSYPVGTVLDFSGQVLREGTSGDAVLYSYNRETGASSVVDASAYSYENGKITFLKSQSDSLYVSFGNTAFTNAKLLTDRFMVKDTDQFGKPSEIVKFSTSVADGQNLALSLGLMGAGESSPKTVYVDFGDGSQAEFSVTTDGLPSQPNVVAPKKGYGEVKIYVPENDVLTAFGTDGVGFYSIELKEATELRELTIRNGGLYSIDLGSNRSLTKLDLSGNYLSSISLRGLNGIYEKNMLADINLSNNRLADVTLNDHPCIRKLNLSDNELTTFSHKDFDYIEDFDISGNKLESINLSYFVSAVRVDISDNAITEVMMPVTNVMKDFDVSGNKLTIATLPYVPEIPNYIYAPQAEVIVATKGPGVDLSAQNRIIDGVGTTFTWKKADGTVLSSDDVEVNNGKARFINTNVGQIYCDMTNPAFPGFGGETPFRTTLIEAAGMPEYKVAEFTTPVGGENVTLSMAGAEEGVTVYIDWSGESVDLQQYQLSTRYTIFNATSVQDATVKVYTYSPDDKITVFSVSGVTMGSFDASPLTDLICLGVYDAGLTDSQVKFPAAPGLRELFVDGNAFETLPLFDYPELQSLSASKNNLTSLDLTPCPNISAVGAGNNKIETVTIDNACLWLLDLAGNAIKSIDLSGAPSMEQLSLSHNSISKLDVTPLQKLRQLLVDHNKFTFATLPLPKASYVQYVYAGQANVVAECVDGKVDLSSQAVVDGEPTVYRWFIDNPEFDDYGELSGEELVAGEEFTVEEGVTTFINSFTDVVCVMTNAKLPSLYLFTDMIKSTDGVADVAAESGRFAVTVSGRDIHVCAEGMADGTPVGLVALDGRTIASATVKNGAAVLRSVAPGVAVIAVGNRAAKVLVK